MPLFLYKQQVIPTLLTKDVSSGEVAVHYAPLSV